MPLRDRLEEPSRGAEPRCRLALGAVVLALTAVATRSLSRRVLAFTEWHQPGAKPVGFGPLEGFAVRSRLAF